MTCRAVLAVPAVLVTTHHVCHVCHVCLPLCATLQVIVVVRLVLGLRRGWPLLLTVGGMSSIPCSYCLYLSIWHNCRLVWSPISLELSAASSAPESSPGWPVLSDPCRGFSRMVACDDGCRPLCLFRCNPMPCHAVLCCAVLVSSLLPPIPPSSFILHTTHYYTPCNCRLLASGCHPRLDSLVSWLSAVVVSCFRFQLGILGSLAPSIDIRSRPHSLASFASPVPTVNGDDNNCLALH